MKSTHLTLFRLAMVWRPHERVRTYGHRFWQHSVQPMGRRRPRETASSAVRALASLGRESRVVIGPGSLANFSAPRFCALASDSVYVRRSVHSRACSTAVLLFTLLAEHFADVVRKRRSQRLS